MAQVLTLDQEKASRLAEKTYARAFSRPDINPINIEDRRYLMQLLLEVYRESLTKPSQSPGDSEAPASLESLTSDSVKRDVLEHILNRVMPTAFASLTAPERVLLILCDVEQFSCADASLVMGSDSEKICAKLDQVRERLVGKVLSNTSPAEAALVQSMPYVQWLGPSLRRILKSSYTALPATLEPRIRSSIARRFTDKAGAPDRKRSSLQRDAGYAPRTGLRVSRGLLTVLLILSAGLAGYIGSAILESEPDSNIVVLSAAQAGRENDPILPSSDPQQIEDFLTEREAGWNLSLPVIDDAHIMGVSISEIVEGVRIPVLFYEDRAEPNAPGVIMVYAYTYALLDEYQGTLDLDPQTLASIAVDDHIDTFSVGSDRNAFVWRSANEIFVAVASSDEERLLDRIQVD